MSGLSPLSGEERKSDFGAVRSVEDPSATSTAQRSSRVQRAIWSTATANSGTLFDDFVGDGQQRRRHRYAHLRLTTTGLRDRSTMEYLAARETFPLDRCCDSSNGTGPTGSCSKSRSA